MNYELKNLTIGYGKKVVASSINATLEGGKVTCLLGPNGAGKSTLLKTLCGFQKPLSGELAIYETDDKQPRDNNNQPKADNGNLLSPSGEIPTGQRGAAAKLLGVVLTEKVNVPGMTVHELVGMGRSPYTNFWGRLTDEDEAIVTQAIHETGIEQLADRQVTTLSDGERQKVMIAKALAQQTPIILLDEPTAFLDFPSKVETMLLLTRLAHQEGKAILISTHDLDIALQTADCLWLMGKNNGATEDTLMGKNNGATDDDMMNKEVTSDGVSAAQTSTLQVGTPHDLADRGLIASFFYNPNVTFDRNELRFKISHGI